MLPQQNEKVSTYDAQFVFDVSDQITSVAPLTQFDQIYSFLFWLHLFRLLEFQDNESIELYHIGRNILIVDIFVVKFYRVNF